MDFSFLLKSETWASIFGAGGAIVGGWNLYKARQLAKKVKKDKQQVKEATDQALQEKVNPVIEHVESNRLAIEEMRVDKMEQRAFIQNLQEDVKRTEAAMEKQTVEFNARQAQLEAIITASDTQFQLVLKQNTELISGIQKMTVAIEDLRITLDGHAVLLKGVDEVLEGLKANMVPVVTRRKRDTGPLKGRAVDVVDESKKEE